MAGQGRGGATSSALVVVAGAVLLCLATTGAAAEKQAAPRTYVVGDGAGWTRNLESWWLAGKTFYAGDVLVFKYDKERHDVTVVDGKGYRRCEVPMQCKHSWVMRTGNDEVTLLRGNNYFICGLPGHCDNNMKLAVKAW